MLMTPELKTSYSFGILLAAAQMISIYVHISGLYEGIVHNFLAVLREFQILFIVLFQLLVCLTDQSLIST